MVEFTKLTCFVAIFTIVAASILSPNDGIHQKAREETVETAEKLLHWSIEALGGTENIQKVETLNFIGSSVFRTRSIPETVSVDDSADLAVVFAGSQNMSFKYEPASTIQRLDRIAALAPPWVFARPGLQPMNFSLVIQTGETQYAANVTGSFSILSPEGPPAGYLDGQMAGFLVFDSDRWNPLLVRKVLENRNFNSSWEATGSGLMMPAVHDNALNLTILFDPTTFLPYLVRGYEQHPLFGLSTYDLRVYDYISVGGLMIPRHYKTVYNNNRLITDWFVEQIEVNPVFHSTWFNRPEGNFTELHRPVRNEELFADLQERYNNYNYLGPFTATIDTLKATQPWSDLPGLWVIELEGTFYRQMLLELPDFVIIFDCPPQQSAVILEWIRQNLNKPVGMVVPTHHHHDHAMGLVDYASTGAKAILPEIAKDYYYGVKNLQVETFRQGTPFVVQSPSVRATIIHMEKNVHAKDHVYVVFIPTCVTNNSSVVVFEADFVIQDLALDTNNDHAELWQFIQNLESDRVAKNMHIVSVHTTNSTIKLDPLLKSTGLTYPDFMPTDFKYNVSSC